MIARRTFIKGASALAATASGLSVAPGSAELAPNSSGSEPAKLKAPAGACDCHHHIYDPVRFPPSRPEVQQVPNARLEDYRLLQRRIGTTRNIVVTPAPYPAPVSDNLATLDALKQLAGNSGYHFQLLTAVIEVNDLQKRRVIGKLHKHLGEGLVGKRVALFGLAFKPNTDDMREASSLVLCGRLSAEGAAVAAYDPVAEDQPP